MVLEISKSRMMVLSRRMPKNVLDDAGDMVGDAARGVGDAVQDVGDAAKNAADDMTGNKNSTADKKQK